MKKLRLVALLVFVAFSLNIISSAVVNAETISEEEIASYLQDAGFTNDEIANMTSSKKLEYYTTKSYVQERNITHGIYTDNYFIDFSIADDGTVIMDEENQKELKSFLSDSTELAKVLHDKKQSAAIKQAENNKLITYCSAEEATLSAETISEVRLESSIKAQEELKKTYLDMHMAEVNAIQSLDLEAAARAASNITQSVVITHKSYNTSTKYLTKSVSYIFDWDYEPFWTLTDQFAIAWSKEFNYPSAGGYSFTYNAYGVANPSGERAYYKTRTTTANDVYYKTPSAGVGHKYDIVRSFFASFDYSVYRHYVSLSFDITKYWSGGQNDEANYVAKYYHKIAGIEGSLSLSATPSISISWATSYDELQNVGGKFSFV